MKPISEIAQLKTPQSYKDTPLDTLLSVLNESRSEVKLPKLSYARLNRMLQKIGKSKKNWDRNIWIANVLDAPNPSKCFWGIMKSVPLQKKGK